MTAAADLLAPARRVVVKIGSSLLIGPDRQPHAARFSAIAADLNALAGRGMQIVLVSSGAVALGRSRLGFGTGRLNLEQKQAAAAASRVSSVARAFSQRLRDEIMDIRERLYSAPVS
jgi:glutamate 5-kinase